MNMTAKIQTFIKDPHAILDYVFDWYNLDDPVEHPPYLRENETITSVVWTVAAGITKDSESKTTTTTTIWLSGGTVGQIYSIACKIVTNQDRTDERTIDVRVENR